MSEQQSSPPTRSLPSSVIISLCFFAIMAIFWGYALLLREKALSEQDLLHDELRQLREEQQQFLSRQAPENAPCDCPTEAIQAAPVPQLPPGAVDDDAKRQQSFVYTVRKGDNLWTIAAHYRVQPEALMRWNNLTPRSRIFPGDELTIILEEEKEQEHREHSPDHVQPGSGSRPAGSSYQILDQPDETVP